MPFRSAVSALVVLLLALFPAAAQAELWEILAYEPNPPVAGDQVTFHADREKANGNPDLLVWNFGDGASGTGPDPTHVYAAAGTYTVTLSRPMDNDTPELQDSVVVTVEPAPAPNTSPSAAFTFSPSNPFVGQNVLFTGGSDPDGDPITRSWDFGDATPAVPDAEPSHAYAAVGPYTVTLTLADNRGAFASSSRNLTVSPQLVGPPPGEGSQPGVSPTTGSPGTTSPLGGSTPAQLPTRIRPFPVVRIAGVVLDDGALVRILSVRAPRGVSVRVRCRGKGCPASTVARTSRTRLVRFSRFERKLRAGIVLELFARRAGKIGKYTRFKIRAAEPPARVDRCLMPSRARPVPCR